MFICITAIYIQITNENIHCAIYIHTYIMYRLKYIKICENKTKPQKQIYLSFKKTYIVKHQHTQPKPEK